MNIYHNLVRILFYTKDISLLTPCIEGLCALIYPFFWQHIYVPVLPRKFIDFLYAPMPFLCGVLPSYMPDLSLLEGVVFVNLDANTIQFHKNDPIPLFPSTKLEKYISRLVRDRSRVLNSNIVLNEQQVREAFIRFYSKFLRDYKAYMNADNNGPSKDKFDKTKWIKDNLSSNEEKKFYELFVEAQLFQCFIDERFDAMGHNFEVLYFDEKIDEINNKATPFLNDTTLAHDAKVRVKVSFCFLRFI